MGDPNIPPMDMNQFMQYMMQSQQASNVLVQELREQNIALRDQNAHLLARLEALEVSSSSKGKGKTGYVEATSIRSGTSSDNADRLIAKVTQPTRLKKESQWPHFLTTFKPFVRRLSPLLPDLMKRAEERDETTVGGEFYTMYL